MRFTTFESLTQMTFMPKVFPMNCYIVEEATSLTLIDTGVAAMVPSLVEYFLNHNKPLTRIVLTHCHSDHIGGLVKLVDAFPNTELLISNREYALTQLNFQLEPDEPQLPIKGGLPKEKVTFEFTLLEEGDWVGSLKAVSTPGHTPGSMSFWHEKERYIVVGDVIQLKGGFAIAGQLNWTFPFPALATWSKDLAIESARKVAKLNPAVIGAGHGDLLYEASDILLKHLNQRE